MSEDLAKLEVEQVLATAEEAAKYAGIDVDTLEQWVENGLLTTEDDGFLKYNLDLFVQSKGNPTPEEKAKQVESVQELAMTLQDDAEGLGGGRRRVREGSADGPVRPRSWRRWTPARSWTCSRRGRNSRSLCRREQENTA